MQTFFLDDREPSSSIEAGYYAGAQPQSNDQVRVLPKWQIVSSGASGTSSTQRASLKPGSAPQKATLLTKNGPQDVSTYSRELSPQSAVGNSKLLLV